MEAIEDSLVKKEKAIQFYEAAIASYQSIPDDEMVAQAQVLLVELENYAKRLLPIHLS